MNFEQMPDSGLIKLKIIIGDPKKGIQGIYPVSAATWYAGIKAGKFPPPVKLGLRSVAWRVSDIKNLLAATGAKAA